MFVVVVIKLTLDILDSIYLRKPTNLDFYK